MENYNGVYVKVSKELFDEVQEMKKREDAIPHYRAQLKPLENLDALTVEEKLQLAKENIREIEKQYQNEDEKGWEHRKWDNYFSNKEWYVRPIIQQVFDIQGLSDYLNGNIEVVVQEEFKEKPEQIRDTTILRRISFVDKGVEDAIMDSLAESSDISNCKFLYRVYTNPFKEVKEPVGCIFWFQNDKYIHLIDCSRSSRMNMPRQKLKEATEYWENRVGKESSILAKWKECEMK